MYAAFLGLVWIAASYAQMACAVFTSWCSPEHCYLRFRVLIKIGLTFTCIDHQMHRGMAPKWRPFSPTPAASRWMLKGPKVWCPIRMGQESMKYFWMRALMEQNDTRKEMLVRHPNELILKISECITLDSVENLSFAMLFTAQTGKFGICHSE